MRKHIIIIGAGVAGLSAGIYAKRSGFDVTIFEQHAISGGMCTSWRRKGYLFEGAIHWLVGSSKKKSLNELWCEVGALDDTVKIRYDEPFKSMEYDGEKICLYRNLDKLQEHFNLLSPQDKIATSRLIKDVKSFDKMEMPIFDIKGVKSLKPRKMSIRTMIKLLAVFPKINRISKLSVSEYIEKFKHPGLRMFMKSIVPEEHSASTLLFNLAYLSTGDGGYPEGGSLAMTKRMEKTFINLGGKLQLKTKVDKVIVENGSAVGVLINDNIIASDAVIITQETLAGAEQLFNNPPQDQWLTKLKENTKPSACCFVSLGIRAVLKETPMVILSEPIHCGGFLYKILNFNNYSDYSDYAPEGCTTLTTFFLGDSYDFWKKARDEGSYESEKQLVAEQVIRALCEKYPQVKDKIEVIDVATPLTYERYTGASKGSWMAAMEKGKMLSPECPCTLANIDNVFFAGHRTMVPGGLPAALMTGRKATQMVCRKYDYIFNCCSQDA